MMASAKAPSSAVPPKDAATEASRSSPCPTVEATTCVPFVVAPTVAGLRCDVDLQVVVKATGQNVAAMTLASARVVKRDGALQVVTADNKKSTMRTAGAEVYCTMVARGRVTFVSFKEDKITKYVLRNGNPSEMANLVHFALAHGAVAATSLAAVKELASNKRSPGGDDGSATTSTKKQRPTPSSTANAKSQSSDATDKPHARVQSTLPPKKVPSTHKGEWLPVHASGQVTARVDVDSKPRAAVPPPPKQTNSHKGEWLPVYDSGKPVAAVAAPPSTHVPQGGIGCAAEIQVAATATGRNIETKRLPAVSLVKRKGGLQLFAGSYKTAIRASGAEVYCSKVARGRVTFIWYGLRYRCNERRTQRSTSRQADKYTQYDLFNGSSYEMADIVLFAITQGAVAKTPIDAAKTLAATPLSKRPPVVVMPSASSKKASTMPSSGAMEASDEVQPTVQLTPPQQQVIEAILSKKNVFFTGRAGTGKSFLLRHIQTVVPAAGLYCTATTGIAAFHIRGMTLHHFAGLQIHDKLDVAGILKSVSGKKSALERWRTATTLIIDEISMLEGALFEALEVVARSLRNSTAFFGGIQLVLSGDFYQVRRRTLSLELQSCVCPLQLPPVPSDKSAFVQFCFEMPAWKRGITRSISLDHVFRQRDSEFVEMLNAIRDGTYTQAMLTALNKRVRANPATHPADTIHMFTHTKDVVAMNTERLAALPGKLHEFPAADSGARDLLRGSAVPPLLQFKQGAKVMLTKSLNVARGLVNGACGEITGFTTETVQWPIVRFDHGVTQPIVFETFSIYANQMPVAARQQLPLALAYAISIHKSQGLTFDKAVLHVDKVFECGQTYVALSRLASLDGLTLAAPLTKYSIRVHPSLAAATIPLT
ncbi:Aste57867_5065 [Aphanomyces stellatus]|uniref:ATP-dependent DNA helicase n=1 Tax=Aphanomyces stellatus TaxID=120398 RepID=A0A485KH37_9STRA|nr:hypothetical protein As57867_005052 [Aphanomyces stellatus]VFT82146.1 Aste57867_5065 [Aphanomyces stellatus]